VSESSTEHIAIVELNGEIADSKDANADDIISGLTDAFEAKNSKAVCYALIALVVVLCSRVMSMMQSSITH
jgi:ClpP class serine protease